jgi:hypothetical protein
MKLKQSLAALVLTAAVAGHADEAQSPASGGSDRPPDPPAATEVVSTPDYTAGAADDSEDAAAQQRANAWTAYQRSVVDALAHSPDPRDWVTASLIPDYELAASTPKLRGHRELLQRGLPAVGDDAYVLWVIAVESEDAATQAAARQRLQADAVENAAAWLLQLNAAAKAKDSAGVDAALHRMADSSRFESYATTLMRATTDAYRRFPPPAELLASMDESIPDATPEKFAVVTGLSISGIHGMPAFQPLLDACRVDAAKRRNLARQGDCGAVGRLLMLHSDTLLASHIGMSVLRVSKSYDADDLRAARESDWIIKQYMSLLPTDESDEAFAQFVLFRDDWLASGSEVAAMHRSVERTGLPLAPPDDWTDPQSIFSELRLRQDAAMLERHDGAND